MTALRQRMPEDLRIRNYSPRTIDTYTRCVGSFAQHFHVSPDRLGPEHIREYQRYLVERKKASWSLFNQSACALRFFYKVTLGRELTVDQIPFAKKERRLPVVLSREELLEFFAAIGNLKHRTVLMTMYAAGLRIAETLSLRVQDVDSKRMTIRVEQGKGKKDRYTILTPTLLQRLREYWSEVRPLLWLFPGADDVHPLHATGIQRVTKRVRLERESPNR